MLTPGDTVWLSGAILTLLNKLVFPVLWLAAIGGAVGWVLVKTGGHISISSGFQWICWLVLANTVFIVWIAGRLVRVGYWGNELIVSDYFRTARIPFKQVQAVEPVWWYWRRMVRIRFYGNTPFGTTVYYLPKWALVLVFFRAPDQELKDILATARG
jgi:hypothetical protein